MGFVVKRLILLTLSACNPTIGLASFSLFLVLRSYQLSSLLFPGYIYIFSFLDRTVSGSLFKSQ